MCNYTQVDTVQLFAEGDDIVVGVTVTRPKLIALSAYYRGLTSSGMRDAGLMKVTVPDVSKIGLQAVADFIEADDKQTVVPTSLSQLEEVVHLSDILKLAYSILTENGHRYPASFLFLDNSSFETNLSESFW